MKHVQLIIFSLQLKFAFIQTVLLLVLMKKDVKIVKLTSKMIFHSSIQGILKRLKLVSNSSWIRLQKSVN